MLMVCTTRLDTNHSCKVWMKSHQLFLRSSQDKFCDRQIDRQDRHTDEQTDWQIDDKKV